MFPYTFAFLSILVQAVPPARAFSTIARAIPVNVRALGGGGELNYKKYHRWSISAINEERDDDSEDSPDIMSRFLSPRIDDRDLPLADALLAQIVAPSLEVFWLSSNHAPLPTWLSPIFQTSYRSAIYNNLPMQGALVAPTLIHGAGLACCWILGALAAKLYQSDAFDVTQPGSYGNVLRKILRAGAFASGILILSTQVDLLIEFGRYVQSGESEATDLRLLSAAAELINDIVFEAFTLVSWRLYRAILSA